MFNYVKKYKSNKIKNKSCEPNSTNNIRNGKKTRSIQMKESLFTKKPRKISVNSEDEVHNNQNERVKILADIFDTINLLFKENEINVNQKIKIKQLIISNPKAIIDKFNSNYDYMNKNSDISDKNLINKNIKTFLLKELDFL